MNQAKHEVAEPAGTLCCNSLDFNTSKYDIPISLPKEEIKVVESFFNSACYAVEPPAKTVGRLMSERGLSFEEAEKLVPEQRKVIGGVHTRLDRKNRNLEPLWIDVYPYALMGTGVPLLRSCIHNQWDGAKMAGIAAPLRIIYTSGIVEAYLTPADILCIVTNHRGSLPTGYSAHPTARAIVIHLEAASNHIVGEFIDNDIAEFADLPITLRILGEDEETDFLKGIIKPTENELRG